MSRMLPEPGLDGLAEPAPVLAGAREPAQQPNAVKLVHRLLRGRYLVTIILGGIGAIAGAIAGYMATSPKYETIGIVSIAPVQPTILTDRESPVPMFPSFVNKQAGLMRSLRVLTAAMESPEWRAAGFTKTPEAEAELRRSLSIDTARDSELILVRCVAKDRQYSETAVEQVIIAYEKIFASTVDNFEPRIAELTRVLESRDREIASTDTAIRDTVAEAKRGTDDLTLVHANLFDSVTTIEARLRDLELQLAEAGVDVDTLEGAPPAEAVAPNPVASEPPPNIVIAASDSHMASLLSQESQLWSELTALQKKGLGDRHQSVRDVTSRLAGVREAIRLRATAWWEANRGVPAAVDPAAETIEQKKTRYRVLKQKYNEELKALGDINDLRARLDSHREKRALQVADRDIVQKLLNNLKTESQAQERIGGRINVVSYGDTPGSPTVDKRKQLAAMGFVAGGGIPVGLMLLVGFLDRRFRYSDQSEDLGVTPPVTLGILPVLPRALEDPEQRAVAAHCVHQVRLLLQIGGQATSRKVYAVTSPTAGDGKTSLALSLGLSFSAAGARTLLIDFDMIGTGLTSSLRLLNGHASLTDVLTRGVIDQADLPMASERLWVIPSRADDDHLVSRLSAHSVKRVLESARDAFDVILIDTGPVLGSLEAAMVSAASDGVILVVGRGQRRDHVVQAFSRIAAVGGKLIGMVFNRATPGDFRRSVSSTSMRSVPRALALPPGAPRPETDRLGDAGPVVRTVALELDAEARAAGNN